MKIIGTYEQGNCSRRYDSRVKARQNIADRLPTDAAVRRAKLRKPVLPSRPFRDAVT
ncbi:hypothetical protein GCM10011494_38370 [Novosphingobium endophyticum]|uniref:Uncharacterized protein n=1 Tax=Novosphingobium endophyticum TaxID=1955250 RepID=A0A916X697_9SPHN|nr:hypothetical protein GCM10011494_38370 [Novosphingobium endophyticum]